MKLKTNSNSVNLILMTVIVSLFMTFVMSFLLSLIASSAAAAAPNLMLFPTRVVFEKNKRAYQVDLTNTGTTPGTYRITLENRRMTEDGQFVAVDKLIAGELPADKMIQYSPRQVVLAPGEGQTVRLILRKPANLAVGEYRSHLVFTRLPDAATNSVEANSPNASGLGVTMTPLIGASIPIIIQNGITSATVKLSNLKYQKATTNEMAQVQFHMDRNGTRSVYGDFTVFYYAKGNTEKELTRVKGIAAYSPYPTRIIKLAIPKEIKIPLTKGKLTVKYNESQSAGGKLISESSIELP